MSQLRQIMDQTKNSESLGFKIVFRIDGYLIGPIK